MAATSFFGGEFFGGEFFHSTEPPPTPSPSSSEPSIQTVDYITGAGTATYLAPARPADEKLRQRWVERLELEHRLNHPDEAQAVATIVEVAVRQAESPRADEAQALNEFLAELNLKQIALESRYLAAYKAAYQQAVEERRLKRNNEAMLLILIAAHLTS